VRGEEGPFCLLENADDPLVPKDAPASAQDTLRDAAPPAALESQDEQGRFVCSAVIWYGDALFSAKFAVQADGKLELRNDNPIAAGLSLRVDAPLARGRQSRPRPAAASLVSPHIAFHAFDINSLVADADVTAD
jgi:hypothetical protein